MTQRETDLRLAAVQPRRALADQVYDSLTALIMDHDIAANARLNIEEIARQLDVSPTPVREALARLESDGLVAKEALRGYRTTDILSRAEYEDLLQFRELVEPWAAAEAARRRGPQDIEQLRAELDHAPADAASEDYAGYAALAAHDHRFHVLVQRIAGNGIVLASFERARVHLHMFRFLFRSSMASYPVTEHCKVGEAIIAGDPDLARAAMLDHLHASHDRIIASLDAIATDSGSE